MGTKILQGGEHPNLETKMVREYEVFNEHVPVSTPPTPSQSKPNV